MLAALVVGVIATAPSTCVAAKHFCAQKVVRADLKYGHANRVLLNVALGDVVSIEFPPEVQIRGEPGLGNAALFEVTAHRAPLRVLVWPKMPSAKDLAPETLIGERSNLQVPLDGLGVIVDLRIARRKRSVERLVFSFPERAKESEFVRAKLSERMKKLETDYEVRFEGLEEEAEAQWKTRVAKGMLKSFRCTDVDERTMRDLIVLRAARLCQVGAQFFLEFSVQNRGRSLLTVGAVQIQSTDGAPTDAQLAWSGPQHLRFDETVRGVATWSAKNGSAPEWSLTVGESGGRSRAIQLNELGF